jgi:hypothetical protein
MPTGAARSLVDRAIRYYRENGARSALSLAGFYAPSLLYHRRFGARGHNTKGIDVFQQDWDNLIVLDACRFDVFDRRADHLDGDTERRRSRASSTSEFIRANFAGKALHDVVYVSANPWYAKLRDAIDAEVFAYYDVHNEPEERPQIDQMYGTTEYAREAGESYPEKRLLVHYIPPHHPLFGPTAEEHLPSIDSQLEMGFYERIRRGELAIDDEVLERAYAETFDRVLSEVETLLPELRGKTVITADHGEMLGERARPIPAKYYGHIPGLYTEQLVTIPWHVCDYDTRREISADPPRTADSDGDDEAQAAVDQRLRDLGYKP